MNSRGLRIMSSQPAIASQAFHSREISDTAGDIRSFNRWVLQKPRASAWISTVYHALRSITGNGARLFFTSNQYILEYLGLDPDNKASQLKLKKALKELREGGWIESYTRGAGLNKGARRFIIVKAPDAPEVLTEEIRAVLSSLQWKPTIQALATSDEWRERLTALMREPKTLSGPHRGYLEGTSMEVPSKDPLESTPNGPPLEKNTIYKNKEPEPEDNPIDEPIPQVEFHTPTMVLKAGEDRGEIEARGSADHGEPIQMSTKSRMEIAVSVEAIRTGKRPAQKPEDEALEDEFRRAYGKTDGSPEAKRRAIDKQVDRLGLGPEVAAQMKRMTYARYGIPEY